MSDKPLFASNGLHAWGTQVTANTALDGTGTLLTLTPGAKCRAKGLIIRHLGSNIATALRVRLNNGSSAATPANNSLIAEATIAANTLSQVAASIAYYVPLGVFGDGIVMTTSERLLVAVGTTIAAGVQITLDAEDLT